MIIPDKDHESLIVRWALYEDSAGYWLAARYKNVGLAIEQPAANKIRVIVRHRDTRYEILVDRVETAKQVAESLAIEVSHYT